MKNRIPRKLKKRLKNRSSRHILWLRQEFQSGKSISFGTYSETKEFIDSVIEKQNTA